MVATARRRVVAGLLSMLVPGLGQLYLGARRRGLILLGGAALAVLDVLGLAAWWSIDVVDGRLVAGLLALDLTLLALRLFAVADAWRGGITVLALLAALTAAPHVAAGWMTVRGYAVLEEVFADEEPGNVLRGKELFLEPPLPRWVAKDAWDVTLVERLATRESNQRKMHHALRSVMMRTLKSVYGS